MDRDSSYYLRYFLFKGSDSQGIRMITILCWLCTWHYPQRPRGIIISWMAVNSTRSCNRSTQRWRGDIVFFNSCSVAQLWAKRNSCHGQVSKWSWSWSCHVMSVQARRSRSTAKRTHGRAGNFATVLAYHENTLRRWSPFTRLDLWQINRKEHDMRRRYHIVVHRFLSNALVSLLLNRNNMACACG